MNSICAQTEETGNLQTEPGDNAAGLMDQVLPYRGTPDDGNENDKPAEAEVKPRTSN